MAKKTPKHAGRTLSHDSPFFAVTAICGVGSTCSSLNVTVRFVRWLGRVRKELALRMFVLSADGCTDSPPTSTVSVILICNKRPQVIDCLFICNKRPRVIESAKKIIGCIESPFHPLTLELLKLLNQCYGHSEQLDA